MLELRADDQLLTALEGAGVTSEELPAVTYRVERPLGAGTFSVAFYALRRAPDGESPVVLKLLRPNLLRRDGTMASLVVEKERTALRRLAERVPPTPFVVELLDAGSLPVVHDGDALRLPWLALEYVHGGAEGTTLEERIDYCVERTGFAFDAARAALALRCLASGLEAVHEVGVVHRDLTTWNILCCGFGAREVFKISDFGIARPVGHRGTFIGSPGGTAGFAPPEQVLGQREQVGPASDVFALASIVYRMLTADPYFPAASTLDGVLLAQQPDRRRLAAGARLVPELHARPAACAAIDAALARATAFEAERRPRGAWDFATEIISVLEETPRSSRSVERGKGGVPLEAAPRSRSAARGPRGHWVWRARHRPGDERVVRSVSWDGDGTCLAATGTGLAFWDGATWRAAPTPGLSEPTGLRFVHRVGAGTWLVGGDRATIARYSPQGIAGAVHGADPAVTYVDASGELNELIVLVGARAGSPPLLFPRHAQRWMEPAALTRAATVSSLARLDADRWLLCGRSRNGNGFVVTYAPLAAEVVRLETPPTSAFTSCRASRDLGLAFVVGARGRTLRLDQGQVTASVVEGEPDLSAVAVDPSGRAYAASTGSIWLGQAGAPWQCVWRDATWVVPFVSLFADVGLVIGMTADGGVVEGRWE